MLKSAISVLVKCNNIFGLFKFGNKIRCTKHCLESHESKDIIENY